jgi:branched-subunit amino acid aminotransferase/4-amino-4-deoxychorismate lyase
MSALTTEVNGQPASIGQLRLLAVQSYGHFTAMQVRDRRVRGLDFHLARLSAACVEMFGAEPGADLIRDHVRHAIRDTPDASVRTMISWPEEDDAATILVTVRPPAELAPGPHSLQTAPYQRPLPHIKQVGGGFGQDYYGRLARRNGYTGVLLTGLDGVLSEAATANVGFSDGTGVVWPDAPALAGITMQVLEAQLADAGLTSRHTSIRLADLPSFASMFISSSRGVAPVGRVDDVALPVDDAFMKTLAHVYESAPQDLI